ncbi:hypothetical protein F5882DRAFT_390563 [Hyaloscypha sp. PMI_1271]|nr:hypothetical protein F5882DRAFT_390563 [Hyaloscypha sp. PMI_1271]
MLLSRNNHYDFLVSSSHSSSPLPETNQPFTFAAISLNIPTPPSLAFFALSFSISTSRISIFFLCSTLFSIFTQKSLQASFWPQYPIT